MCEYYAYQTTALLMETIPTCFELYVSYDWRVMAPKLSPKMHHVLVCRLLGLLFMYYGRGTYSQATPTLLITCIIGCDVFASIQL